MEVCTSKKEIKSQGQAGFFFKEQLEQARLYQSRFDYVQLIQFIARMPHLTPFNALLLNMQNPYVNLAFSADDWQKYFQCNVKLGSRPYIITRAFGPVSLIYDAKSVLDSNGHSLDKKLKLSFNTNRKINALELHEFIEYANKFNISVQYEPLLDVFSGCIEVVEKKAFLATTKGKKKTKANYIVYLNDFHSADVQFINLVYELSKLALGFLGKNEALSISDRRFRLKEQQEVEAVFVAYLLCLRVGMKPPSDNFLLRHEKEFMPGNIDLNAAMRAAQHVEKWINCNQERDYWFNKSNSFFKTQDELDEIELNQILQEFYAAAFSIGEISYKHATQLVQNLILKKYPHFSGYVSKKLLESAFLEAIAKKKAQNTN
ncbi:hypothetical protein [Thiosulfativibrio zosterae]|uniref:Uncharacterized protein n=1 Tax=Thiosulfativibrio zosterae TaxID=2675053 RepID=A0A6F8PR06_9GAMM|nr:hypothetical protein [Thiosulfativibrio zosterae]BBP44545.1 hypothetical protein THMIRHAT_22910 [Thiosulfativibrio zosterae]